MATNSDWTDELKAQVIEAYKDADPTPENTMEIVTQVAKDFDKTPHGVRMVLSTAKEYIKKTPASGTSSGSNSTDKPKRVSKQDSIDALNALLESEAIEVDDTITSKLTGKAALWFVDVIKQILGEVEVEED